MSPLATSETGDVNREDAVILPNVRMSLGREDVEQLVRLLGGGDPAHVRSCESDLAEHGLDALLDDRRTLESLSEQRQLTVLPPTLTLYILVRHAMLESDIDSRVLADYVAALLLEFGRAGRSTRISRMDDKEYHYLVDIVDDLQTASGRRAFLLRTHLGNMALWLSGLFPDHIVARVHRRGGPGLDYYEHMGMQGFRMAAEHPFAKAQALGQLFREVATRFGELRRALNRFSDRYLVPRPTSPVDRLLRQVRSRWRTA